MFDWGRLGFRERIPPESPGTLINPGRGWYQVYGFDTAEEPDWDELAWCLKPDETLALLMLDIGRFRQEPVSGEALGRIARILEFFGDAGKELIVRIVYDREGRGMEREPSNLSMVLTHMRQLGPLLQRYRRLIYTLQGLFVGSWGEMHTSRYLAPQQLKLLADTLWEAVEGSCFLAVRRPVQWRIIQGMEQKSAMRIGLYNDGIFGSISDLGTYGEEASGSWQQAWSREQELDFQEKICADAPSGGETVGAVGEDRRKISAILSDLRRMRLGYLNGVYDPVRLGKWKKEIWTGSDCFRGKSVYSYIGDHLGYRFVVRKAQLNAGREKLRVTVENIGFAAVCEAVAPELVLAGADGIRRLEAPDNVGAWLPGCRHFLDFPLEKTGKGSFRVYLGLSRQKDGRRILFANERRQEEALEKELGEYVLLGELLGR